MNVLVTLTFCLCAVLATANRIPSDPTQPDVLDHNLTQPDVFDTMDDYSLLGVLEWVDSFGDLATIAAMSPRARQLILEYNLIASHNIRNATLSLHIMGNNRVGDLCYRSVGGDYFEILCSGRDHTLAAFKAFCPLFGQLDIELNYFHPHGNFSAKIIDYINRYCSTVPQRFQITEIRNAVQEFTAPNVFSVSIQAPEYHANFSIAAHFPRVQELCIRNNDYFTSTEYLPHLRRLEVEAYLCGRFNFRAFAEKNPQITSAKLVLCEGLHILQEVNELLPNLVSLYYEPGRAADAIPQTGENTVQSVHFRNVKEYTIDLDEYFANHRWNNIDVYYAECFAKFSPIHFDQLETLKYISGLNSYRYGQLDLVGQYKGATSLDYCSYPLAYDELRYLVDSLPNLREISFLLNTSITENGNFLRLLEETNLDTIHVPNDYEVVEEFCDSTLPEQWILHEGITKVRISKANFVFSTRFMTFSRKQIKFA